MVVNKSGKVVSTSKHLVNVFKDAKSAYLEKKAEIRAGRDGDLQKKQARKALAASAVADDRYPPSPSSHASRDSSTSSRRSSRQPRPSSHRRTISERSSNKPPFERGYSDSFYANDNRPRRTKTDLPSPLRFMEDAEHEGEGKGMVLRRHSYSDVQSSQGRSTRRKQGPDSIDMDLAYGELPPPLPSRHLGEEQELRTKVTALNRMLEEANCLQYSVTAMVKNLESNPDAMAAVALTMAEISNIATKLGPGALMALKGAFPAVVALLFSPEFLIAAGVGVGITIVMLGGYKIVKKIKAKKDMDNESQADELEELDTDVNRIESWRRGIADAETASIATSVEGEFITPGAAAELRKEGKLPMREKSKAKKKPTEKIKEEKSLSSRDVRKAREKEAKRDKERADKAEKAEKKKHKEEQALVDKLDKQAKKEKAIKEHKELERRMLA